MSRLLFRALLLTAIVCAEVVVVLPVARAQGADPCPEPNDAFQAACYLGTGSDALGFISAAEDVDAYRFEVLDFGVRARLELAEMPAPYRLHLADWNGRVIAESAEQGGGAVLEHTLGPPGSYYLFVDSRTGEASDAAPYRLTTQLAYDGAVPTAAYANEFRSGQQGLCTIGPVNPGLSGCEARDGKFIVLVPSEGRTSSPQIPLLGAWGPELADFTVVADTRLTGNPVGTMVFLGFRAATLVDGRVETFNGYRLALLLDQQRLLLRKFRGMGERGDLLPTEGLDVGGVAPMDVNGVNRLVVRGVGTTLLVNINGVEVARVQDDWFPSGRFAFGAGLYGPLPIPTISFDNVLVTVP